MLRRSAYSDSIFLALFWWGASWLVLGLFGPVYPPGLNLLISLNISAFVVCAIDKLSAPSGQRVPERVLLGLSVLGGGGGLLLAMNLVRHKTRKVGFQLVLLIILLVQLLILRIMANQAEFFNLPNLTTQS